MWLHSTTGCTLPICLCYETEQEVHYRPLLSAVRDDSLSITRSDSAEDPGASFSASRLSCCWGTSGATRLYTAASPRFRWKPALGSLPETYSHVKVHRENIKVNISSTVTMLKKPTASFSFELFGCFLIDKYQFNTLFVLHFWRWQHCVNNIKNKKEEYI